MINLHQQRPPISDSNLSGILIFEAPSVNARRYRIGKDQKEVSNIGSL